MFSQSLVPAAVAPVSATTDLLELVTRFTEPVWPDLTLVIIWTRHTRLLKQVNFIGPSHLETGQFYWTTLTVKQVNFIGPLSP